MIVPFEMVDAVLAEAGGMQQRVRMLPSRVVVYLLLAAGLFAELGYLGCGASSWPAWAVWTLPTRRVPRCGRPGCGWV
jgi:hypothetical protein